MTLMDAVRSCLKDNYANFDGRARRSEFWYFELAIALVLVPLYLVAVAGLVSQTTAGKVVGGLALALMIVVGLGTLVPRYAVGSRRLHDTGKSGWLQLLGLVGLSIVVLVFDVMDSTPGPNQYGANPKGVAGGYPSYPAVGGPQQYPPVGGQPQYGQPQYGQPQYGQPQYGEPQYGQPQHGQPPSPPYGQQG